MHTYLPFSKLTLNAAVLAEPDLSQQIRAGMTILSTLHARDRGWQWHPSIQMWDCYEDLLAQQILTLVTEWKAQGLKDNIHASEQLVDMGYDLRYLPSKSVDMPWWWGDKKFHAAEKAALVRYDRAWYGPIFKNKVDPGLPQLWPTMESGKFQYGPAPSPDGKFDYVVDGKPMFPEVGKMTDEQFLFHINTFHRLLGSKKPITMRDSYMFGALKGLHDRFHSLRFYSTHDHIR